MPYYVIRVMTCPQVVQGSWPVPEVGQVMTLIYAKVKWVPTWEFLIKSAQVTPYSLKLLKIGHFKNLKNQAVEKTAL